MTLNREYKSVFVPLLVVLAAAGPGSSVTSFGNKPEHTAEKYTLRPASLPVMYQSLFRNWRNSRSGLEYLRLLHPCIVPHSHMHVSQNMNVHLLTAAIKATLSARGYVAPVDATWWRPLWWTDIHSVSTSAGTKGQWTRAWLQVWRQKVRMPFMMSQDIFQACWNFNYIRLKYQLKKKMSLQRLLFLIWL